MSADKTVLVVGGGGREHAIAWALARSPSVGRIIVCPANAGVASLSPARAGVAITSVPGVSLAPAALVALATEQGADLTIIGPEAPLADGVVDAFQAAGLRCFGPTQVAAELEASKAFSKSFMARHDIPTARFATFTDFTDAQRYVIDVGAPVVVKASGLAAGKGVIVCHTLAEAQDALSQIMRGGRFGEAGAAVVIEALLHGQELSVMAFCDGRSLALMPAVQDHKAAYDGERGPNTGGMGAYTPVPIATPALLAAIESQVLRRAVDGMAAEGRTYVGVLYAGIMVTPDGPMALEFNCRFGDPETQVVLPLLNGDLAAICEACIDGRLDAVDASWRQGASATVVAASGGYPGPYEVGRTIRGVDRAEQRDGVTVFHAGTATRSGELVTAGGRVLAVTATAAGLEDAIAQAYEGIDEITFTGMHVRRDIGHRALADTTADEPGVSYRDAGVDIDAGARAVALMRSAVESTHGPHVVGGLGSFGGMFDVSDLKSMARPVLVASTDGVGTKTVVAAQVRKWDTIGADLVNHCINDILVQGARPLFFLDYLAAATLSPEVVADVVRGCASACRAAGVALLGGETAEMPGVYTHDALDLAGTIIGVVERDRIIDGSQVAVGDVVLALPSSGLHTNGYSLARKVFEGADLNAHNPALGTSIGQALLVPHRSYLSEVTRLMDAGLWPTALVHVTGGGLIENPPRVLPAGAAMRIDTRAWTVPPLFREIQQRGRVADDEMRRVFNQGLGMLIVVPAGRADAARALLGPEGLTVGAIIERAGADAPQVVFR